MQSFPRAWRVSEKGVEVAHRQNLPSFKKALQSGVGPDSRSVRLSVNIPFDLVNGRAVCLNRTLLFADIVLTN